MSWFECSEAALKIIGMGGQILLPVKLGDAQVVFSSRWSLARAIDEARAEAHRFALEQAENGVQAMRESGESDLRSVLGLLYSLRKGGPA